MNEAQPRPRGTSGERALWTLLLITLVAPALAALVIFLSSVIAGLVGRGPASLLALDQAGQFAVGRKTQRDQLSLSQFRGSRAERVLQQRSEPQSLFEADNSILSFQRVEARLESQYQQSHRQGIKRPQFHVGTRNEKYPEYQCKSADDLCSKIKKSIRNCWTITKYGKLSFAIICFIKMFFITDPYQ